MRLLVTPQRPAAVGRLAELEVPAPDRARGDRCLCRARVRALAARDLVRAPARGLSARVLTRHRAQVPAAPIAAAAVAAVRDAEDVAARGDHCVAAEIGEAGYMDARRVLVEVRLPEDR